MNKKGQAAMEFLTTYGWAFLIIIIVLAGLYYMDVFNTDRALTTGLTLDERLLGGDTFAIDLESYFIAFEVKNMLDAPITLTEVTLYEKSGANVAVDECKFNRFLSGSEIPARNWGEVILSFGPPAGGSGWTVPSCGFVDNAGKMKTFTMEVKYTPAGSAIETVSKGEMTVSVGTYTGGSVDEVTYKQCFSNTCRYADAQPPYIACPENTVCTNHENADCTCEIDFMH
ncbi:MAG: hypothetical protein PHU51_04315 [Candidatus Nanoarchaeia archaeon]|nr:hypothetical protein [Candidatus Nanoarchaeia archaeon]